MTLVKERKHFFVMPLALYYLHSIHHVASNACMPPFPISFKGKFSENSEFHLPPNHWRNSNFNFWNFYSKLLKNTLIKNDSLNSCEDYDPPDMRQTLITYTCDLLIYVNPKSFFEAIIAELQIILSNISELCLQNKPRYNAEKLLLFGPTEFRMSYLWNRVSRKAHTFTL